MKYITTIPFAATSEILRNAWVSVASMFLVSFPLAFCPISHASAQTPDAEPPVGADPSANQALRPSQSDFRRAVSRQVRDWRADDGDIEDLLPTRPSGQVMTWRDGGRTRKVYLQADLVVSRSGAIALKGSAGGGRIPIGDDPAFRTSGSRAEEPLPVFRSPSGRLMTLPGGVLVIFEDTWTKAEIEAFFAARGISPNELSPLGELPKGFVVATEPGFPSLELANALAKEPGLKVASPNWLRYDIELQ